MILNKFFKIASPLLFLMMSLGIKAQSEKSREIGFILGAASFSTDYGQRNNFKANVGGNIGTGIGIIYYINFTDYRYVWNLRSKYFDEHFRIRTEASFMTAKLEHFGEYAESPGEWGDRLRAHTGKANLLNAGAQLEYHLVNIVDFGSRRILRLKWAPYISTGVFLNYYSPSITSTYDTGNWEDPGVLYPKWDNTKNPGAASDEPGVTWSTSFGVGTRYKLGNYSDLLIESRWQYFFSNYIDGLDAKTDPANKFNDGLLWVHVGFIYYLN